MSQPQPPPSHPAGRAAACVAVGIAAAGPWSRPDVALLAGIAVALLNLAAWPKQAKLLSKYLIQACVVLLGLRLDLHSLADAALSGLALAVGTILAALAAGWLLGTWLRAGREVTILVSSGTAICGASAIGAVGTAIGAASATMAVATGAIFILNAVGLWTLPAIGHALHMSQHQFGQWAGVALHDIASVGGAGKAYGPVALDTANVVKLTRVLWIFPLALLASRFAAEPGAEHRTKAPFPWFILFFIAASTLRTLFPDIQQLDAPVRAVSGVGFQAALYMIGLGLSRDVLAKVGWRALALAALVWIFLAAGSLAVILLA